MRIRRALLGLAAAIAGLGALHVRGGQADDTRLRKPDPFVEIGESGPAAAVPPNNKTAASTGDSSKGATPAVSANIGEPQQPGGVNVPACAQDPSKLGLERVVEIDPAGGPVFGGSHGYSNFLKDKEVVLTFDDGPLRPYTRPVLKALAEHCTRATFFMVGRMAAADPGMVKEVLAAGHTVGSHTWSHQNLRPLNFFKAREEFEKGLSIVNLAAGRPVAPFFRFPYLSASRSVQTHLKSRNTATFFIDVDSKDFQTRDGEIVFNRIMSQLASTRKGIILMHDIQPSTAHMIPRLLSALHQKGFKVVHMVPSTSSATVAEYDAQAAKVMAAKAHKSQGAPLADRSLVWTMAPAEPGAGKDGAPPASATAPGKKTWSSVNTGSLTNEASEQQAKRSKDGPAKSDELPWAATTTKPTAPVASAPAPAAKRTQRQQKAEELPWQARVFAN